MTLAIAIEKRLESEIARALEIMGHVRDRPEGLNAADTKAAFIDPILSAVAWELLFSPWQFRLQRSRCERREMDVFDLDERTLDQYSKFARSFTKIRSLEIREKVDELYRERRFWPEPLIQLNPHYESGGSILEVVSRRWWKLARRGSGTAWWWGSGGEVKVAG